MLIKVGKTLEMKRNGEGYYRDTCPESYKIAERLAKRKIYGKPIDGRCFKDAGDELKAKKEQGLI